MQLHTRPLPVTKGPTAVGVESGKLAWTCSTTHPNRWAQSIPLSSTSSEAARSFVLTIHKRPFKWRDSVISEILASGLCRIEKREGEKIHPWPINSNYLSGFFSCRCYLERKKGVKKCAHSRCNMYKWKAGWYLHPPGERLGPSTPIQLWYGWCFCSCLHRFLLRNICWIASPWTKFRQGER